MSEGWLTYPSGIAVSFLVFFVLFRYGSKRNAENAKAWPEGVLFFICLAALFWPVSLGLLAFYLLIVKPSIWLIER